jgi:phenylpyruvate tautomerase PptA (4-oxalocrotonate tautomerase family)
MPIIDVSIVVAPGQAVAADLAQSLANSVGRALALPPAQAWVRLHVMPQDRYAENDTVLSPSELPVFAVVLTRQPPDDLQLPTSITKLTHAISEATGRAPASVHIEFAPSARGRASFGGKLVE